MIAILNKNDLKCNKEKVKVLIMANLLDAIINIINNNQFELREYAESHNRANNMGEALEEYVKDAFADTFQEKNLNKRNLILSKNFSYLGNQNNPPDSILIDGDAIEVKKIENSTANLALNSSYPKKKLFNDDQMITSACRNCENWQEKDILYAVGEVNAQRLKSLSFVYGIDYCASREVYERIKHTIKSGVEGIKGVEFSETKELGRVNRVDPLGITYLRVRGMWGIENPNQAFRYIYTIDPIKKFNLMAIINNEKYNKFDNRSKFESYLRTNKSIKMRDVSILNPDNPAKTVKAKLISFSV